MAASPTFYVAVAILLILVSIAVLQIVTVEERKVHAAAFIVGGRSGVQILVHIPSGARDPEIHVKVTNNDESTGAVAAAAYLDESMIGMTTVSPGSSGQMSLAAEADSMYTISVVSVGGEATGSILVEAVYGVPAGETPLVGVLGGVGVAAGALLGYSISLRQNTSARTGHSEGAESAG